MTEQSLEKGRVLIDIIKSTEKGIEDLDKIHTSMLTKVRKDNFYDDGGYSLHISKHSDGSGPNADLCRYAGNPELISEMIKVLERQLKGYKEEFDNL
jgi:hypothetical protein